MSLVTLQIEWRRLLAPLCAFRGHVWKHYTVIHPAWNSPGRFCERCALQDIWRYEHNFDVDPAESYLVDSKGRRVSV